MKIFLDFGHIFSCNLWRIRFLSRQISLKKTKCQSFVMTTERQSSRILGYLHTHLLSSDFGWLKRLLPVIHTDKLTCVWKKVFLNNNFVGHCYWEFWRLFTKLGKYFLFFLHNHFLCSEARNRRILQLRLAFSYDMMF